MPFKTYECTLNSYELPTKNAVKKVNNMIYFPEIYKGVDKDGNLKYINSNNEEYSTLDIIEIRNSIKKHIMENGAVVGAINSNGLEEINNFGKLVAKNTIVDGIEEGFNLWQYKTDIFVDHAITIIGWDDTFPRENFPESCRPENNGAYIVLNSWGKEWGQDGIFYVSYEDAYIESNVSGICGVEDINYDNIYQYDLTEMTTSVDNKYAANVFTAEKNEILSEIMVGSLSNQMCNIYINPNSDDLDISKLTVIKSNVELKPGYNSIKLDQDIRLSGGDKFSVILELLGNSKGIGAEWQITSETMFTVTKSKIGESFISDDGISWMDLYNKRKNVNLCIKAYTREVEKSIECSEILGDVYENINGSLYLTIKTNYDEKDNIVNIKIYKDAIDVTNKFIIQGNTIKGNGAFIKITPLNNVIHGEYIAKIKLSDFDEITRNFTINYIDLNNVKTIQFNDINFWGYISRFIDFYGMDENLLTITSTEENTAKLKILNECKGKNIRDITGIEEFKNLQNLVLSDNRICNLEPLSELDNVEILALSKLNEGVDLKPIFEIDNLNSLQISECSWLTENSLFGINKLENLRVLYLNDNNIGNLTFLNGLNLNELSLANYFNGLNHFSNIMPIMNQENLRTLIIESVKEIENIEPLLDLQNLRSISASKCGIRDLGFLNDSNIYVNCDKQIIVDNFTVNKEEEAIIEVPKIIEQACDENSITYAGENGVTLINCEWNEFGKTIKVDNDIYNCNIKIADQIYDNEGKKIIGVGAGSIVEIDISRIEFDLPKKTYYKGENLDLKNGIVRIYSKDNIQEIPMTDNKVTVSEYNPYKLGNQEITIEYEGKEAKFTVTVTNEVIGIAIKEGTVPTTSVLGDELDLSNAKIVVTRENGETEEEAITKAMLGNSFKKDELGEQTVTVTYEGKTATFKVAVTNEVTGIEVKAGTVPTTSVLGDELDLSNAKIVVTREAGNPTEEVITKEMLGESFNKDQLGEQTVTVTYEGKTATFKVTVENEELEVTVKDMDEVTKEGTTYLIGNMQNVTQEELEAKIETNGKKEIIAKGPKGEIGTGSIIRITKGDDIKEYTLVIIGDLTGDGIMNDIDLLKMARYGVGLDTNLTGAYLMASNIEKDEDYGNDLDLLKIARILVGLDNL